MNRRLAVFAASALLVIPFTACESSGGTFPGGDTGGTGPGTGGIASAAGRDASVATGGASGSGATLAGSGGSAGASCFTPGSTGGLINMPDCGWWMANGLDVQCDGAAGGAGGAGTRPALARLCERRGFVILERTILLRGCFERLTRDPCAPDHEAQVRACLDGYLPQCGVDDDVCVDIVNACPEVTPGDCWLALDQFRADDGTSQITPCFAELAADPGDSCKERFMQCAWGL